MRFHRYQPGEARLRKIRAAFLEEIGRCMVCGSARDLACHEIARGADRGKAFMVRAAWLCVCWPCNQKMTNAQVWPVARQLALKLVLDPVFYDRVAVNRIRSREPDAITQAEVEAYLHTLERAASHGNF